MIHWWNRRTLEQSLTISTALLVVLLVGTTLLLVHSRVVHGLRRQLETRGAAMARSIGAVATPSLLAYNYTALQLAAEGAAGDPDVIHVVIRDKEGAVAGAAGPGRDRAVVAEPGPREDVLEVTVPVKVDGVEESWGAVTVGLSHAPIEAELRRLDMGLGMLGLALAGLAVAVGRGVARRLTAPLRSLVGATEALSAGDMSHRIEVSGPKELAELAGAFNVMIDRIQEKARESSAFQEALEALNTTLEQTVRERTAAYQESEAQYKTLVEHSPDAILIVQEGRVRFVNRSFVETFGITESEAVDPRFRLEKLFEPSSASLARGRISAWEKGESPGTVEVLGKDAEGNVRHMELRGSRIEYRGSPAAECLLIDMTEAKRLRERLSETEKLRSLGELAGGVAHDFNNLLGAILGRVQLLRRREFPAEVDRDLAVVERAAQDGRETVRRIQEFSRTRRDRRFAAVDMGEVLRDAVEITRTRWKAEAEGRNVAITVDTEIEPVPPILGNAAELREVFTNLILNAVDAMPQGGRLTVACSRKGEEVMAQVRDTGVGMTEEIRRHLFDPFFTTKGSKGMGLGMSVAYGIVTRHEGRIDVSTALGQGTTFALTFPVAVDALVPAGGDGAEMPQLVRPGRILVIDDEPEIAEILRDVLAAEGHAVETALSGGAGVGLARSAPFDLVFTDLGMPDMSGWEVADQIRADTPDRAVVLVTGWGATLDEDEARKRGILAIVHKPFDIDDLVRTTANLLSTVPR